MKGAVKTNIPPPLAARTKKLSWQQPLVSVETNSLFRPVHASHRSSLRRVIVRN